MAFCTPRRDELLGISLCAGYGGLDLGIEIAEPRYRTGCYVEREAHAAASIVARMADQALAPALIWDDLKTFDGKAWRGRVHILSAGYPCQPFSFAGKRRGKNDPRHLWPDVARIINETMPQCVFLENVEGHIDLGFSEVAPELRQMGYHAKAGLFTAREAGARHRRRRLFIMAYANSIRCGVSTRPDVEAGDCPTAISIRHIGDKLRPVLAEQCSAGMDSAMDDCSDDGLQPISIKRNATLPLFAPGPGELQVWEGLINRRSDLQPAIFRDEYGMADRVDRTRGAGNGVCSLAAAIAWRTLKADFAREGWNVL